MHMIQAQILAQIIEWVQDKCGEAPDVVDLRQNSAGEIEVRLAFTIGCNYSGMRP